jgi:hypothetical protein
MLVPSRWKPTTVSALLILSAGVATLLLAASPAAATGGGCSIVVRGENGGHDAVQLAINSASPGQTICLRPGSYPEQLTIATAGIHLRGTSPASTLIDPASGTVNAADYDNAQFPLIAVVLVKNVTGVELSGLTVNGAGPATSITGCSPGLVGIDFQNVSSGLLSRVAVENVELSPSLLGCQSQTGVYAYVGSATPPVGGSHVTIVSSQIVAYGKGGIVCDDTGLTCNITGDTVTGLGPTPAIAANGIQVAFGAVGQIARSIVTGNVFTGATATNDWFGNGYSSSGILLYQAAAGTSVTNSRLSANQIGILAAADRSDTITGNTVVDSTAYGIVEDGDSGFVATIAHNVVRNPTTQSIGIFVDNGTFTVRGNTVAWVSDSGTQGASQAVTGTGTVYPSAPAASIPTAAIQAVADGGTTIVNLYNNHTHQCVVPLETLVVLGGSLSTN